MAHPGCPLHRFQSSHAHLQSHHHHHHMKLFISARTSPVEEPEERQREREMGSYAGEAAESPLWISSSANSEGRKEEEEEEKAVEEEEVMGIQWKGWREEDPWPRKSGGGVMLEGYVDGADGGEEGAGGFGRTKSLTDEDLEELKGCLDLGFGFSYEEIPELCNTLPALELCYSMSQRFLDDQQQQQQQNRSLNRSSSGESIDLCPSPSSPPIANWKISSPGDDPDEVKARLKYWAQAVACTIRLCN